MILKELLTWKDSPERQYLLQCADWRENEFKNDKWTAYSPIYNDEETGLWPIYDLNLKFTDKESYIEFHSWKGDYDPEKWYLPEGNLPYKGKRRKLKGTIWTRG